jgi:hypothetical protein
MPNTAGYGTKLEYGSTILSGTPTWTEISGVDEITPPEVTVESKSTRHLKTANKFKTKAPSWKDAGSLSGALFYDKTQYSTLLGLVGTERAWRVTLADGSKTEFDGFLSKLGNPVDIDGDVKVAIEITPGDLPTFTPGT